MHHSLMDKHKNESNPCGRIIAALASKSSGLAPERFAIRYRHSRFLVRVARHAAR
jgi:hypothetical protein